MLAKKQTTKLRQVARTRVGGGVIPNLTCNGFVSASRRRRESKSLLAARKQLDSAEMRSGRGAITQPLRDGALESALSEPSPCQVDRGYHDMKNVCSLAAITQTVT